MSFSACHTVNMNTSAPDPGGNASPLEGGLVVTQIPIYTLNGVGPGAIPLTVGCQSMRVRCPSCKGEVDTSLLTAPTRKTHLCAMTLYICCCWPFVCLPYFINYCKNVQHYCPNCGHFIGSYSF